MYPKRGKSENERSARPRKRKFNGNQHKNDEKVLCESSTSKKVNTSNSKDKNPKHGSCPAGAESWCEWQRAKAMRKLATFTHPPCVIRPDVEKHILPIYEDLSKDDLLVRCMGGHTQNANESFNATVWRIAPKHLNSGPKVVQIAAFIAAGIFNEGYTAVLTLMRLLDLKIGQQCKIFADKTDESRIERAEQRHSDCTKEARIARRAEKTQQNELLEKAEGCLYGPGVAD